MAEIAIEASRVTGPVTELVKRRRVICARVWELPLLRQSDRVGDEVVEGPVTAVLDARPGVPENRFGALVGIPRARLLLERRQTHRSARR